jgi:YidC/Oxa1 family membrane protein insertase
LEKRTILALILIFVVFWLSNEMIWKTKTPEPVPVEQEATRVTDPVRTSDREAEQRISRDPEETSLTPSMFASDTDIPLDNRIVLNNDKIEVWFSNLGGVVNSVFLNDYLMPDEFHRVNLIPEEETLLSLKLFAGEEDIDLSRQKFQWEKEVIDGYPAVIFYIEEEGPRLIEKVFILVEGYHLLMYINIGQVGQIEAYELKFSSGITDTEESLKQKGSDYRFIGQVQNVRRSINLNRIKEGEEITGNIDWAAIRSKYFIKAIQPEQRLQTESIKVFEYNESPAFDIIIRPGRVVSDISDRFDLYLGPLDYESLKDFSPGMEETVELGWKFIRPMGRFFLWVLTNLNKVVPNYGFCIILFALMLKIVLYPLTHKSFQSTHKMQKMNPYMQEIKTKYKSDPKKMQEEMQKLYKEHGVNPVGGCLPLILQMPIFFALYPVLRYSIELRQASFIFWITDLSEPDPYIILPILMGIFMFIQQKISMPKSIDREKMDDKQAAAMQSQKMMLYIMPVFMVFIFRSLPSGLVLYWTIFNIFSIFQQYFIVKKINR